MGIVQTWITMMLNSKGLEKYTCPVCGFPNLDEPPWDPVTKSPSFDICPCCGFEFGYDNATPTAMKKYRLNWVKTGARWFLPNLKPPDWSLRQQLLNIDIDLENLNIE